MIRLFLSLLFLPLFLLARENPFFPVDNAEDIPLTSNKIEKAPPLKRATLTFPSTARILESVTVEYKNLDGSIATKKIQLHNAVDWHLPLFISQSYATSDTETKRYSQTKKRKTAPKKAVYKKIASLPFITFYAEHKKLKVVTKDKLLRDFLLVKPHRIVCDFKRDTDIRSYVKSVGKGSYFKKIRVGTHKGYYRVVIELDGYYQYRVKKTASGYIFTLL
jgi:hypothetical protein